MRGWGTGLAAAVLTLALAGCSGGGGSELDKQLDAVWKAAGGDDVTLLHVGYFSGERTLVTAYTAGDTQQTIVMVDSSQEPRVSESQIEPNRSGDPLARKDVDAKRIAELAEEADCGDENPSYQVFKLVGGALGENLLCGGGGPVRSDIDGERIEPVDTAMSEGEVQRVLDVAARAAGEADWVRFEKDDAGVRLIGFTDACPDGGLVSLTLPAIPTGDGRTYPLSSHCPGDRAMQLPEAAMSAEALTAEAIEHCLATDETTRVVVAGYDC